MGLLSKIISLFKRNKNPTINGKVGEDLTNFHLNNCSSDCPIRKGINDLILLDENGMSHQIDHVEIRENGIFCIETKNYAGWIFGNEECEYWIQNFYNKNKRRLYNPIKQNKTHCDVINKVIGDKYKINSLIVMTKNNADKIKSEKVINLNELVMHLEIFDNGVHLSNEEIIDIYNKLESARSTINKKQHIDNVKKVKKALNKNICPMCGAQLILKKGKFGEFYSCANFPKCSFTKEA